VCDCMVFCAYAERSREIIYARKGIGPILLQYRAMKLNTGILVAANEIVSGDKSPQRTRSHTDKLDQYYINAIQ
jgi:hypothetical protein